MDAEKIREELDKGLELESIEVKMPLTVMKPLHAKWLSEMYNVMTSEQGKDVIASGWEASGICEAIKIGLLKLPSLDPFKDISPIVDESIDFSSPPPKALQQSSPAVKTSMLIVEMKMKTRSGRETPLIYSISSDLVVFC